MNRFKERGAEMTQHLFFISVGPVIPGGLHSCIARFRFTGLDKDSLFSFYN